MAYIDKIAFLCMRDGRILSARSKGKDTFYLPGGKREGQESDLETLAREVKEELSVDIVPKSERLYGVFEAQAHGKAEGDLVRMSCYTAEFTGCLQANSEIDELAWLQLSDANRVSPVDQLIFEDLRGKGLLR